MHALVCCVLGKVGAGGWGGNACGGSVGDRWFEDKSAWESGSLPWDQRPLYVRVCRCTDDIIKCAFGCVIVTECFFWGFFFFHYGGGCECAKEV